MPIAVKDLRARLAGRDRESRLFKGKMGPTKRTSVERVPPLTASRARSRRASIASRGMVVTPWGDSDSLRDRKLQPVRGAPVDEVRQNQRERLFAAMVACVAERGFAATTVEGLVELSG